LSVARQSSKTQSRVPRIPAGLLRCHASNEWHRGQFCLPNPAHPGTASTQAHPRGASNALHGERSSRDISWLSDLLAFWSYEYSFFLVQGDDKTNHLANIQNQTSFCQITQYKRIPLQLPLTRRRRNPPDTTRCRDPRLELARLVCIACGETKRRNLSVVCVWGIGECDVTVLGCFVIA
jgi:hypothetical protein